MRETEKIWMNGELVDWGDAKIHVGAHGLHYGSGVFEGIRCYETDSGPAVFRLTDHLKRLDRLRAAARHGAAVLRRRAARRLARAARDERAARVLPAPDRVLRLRRARRLDRRQPRRGRADELAVGRVPRRRGRCATGIRGKISSWKRVGAERDPARRQGDRHLPELDARGHRGEPAPATTRRSCSPTTASSPTAPARTSSSSRTGRSPRRRSRRRSSPGITRDTVITAGARASATRSSRRT